MRRNNVCPRHVVRVGVVVLVFASALSASAAVTWQTVASGPNATAAFEDPDNWSATDYDPPPPTPPGPEQTPPGPDSTWFIEGDNDDPLTPEDESRPSFNGIITLSSARDGSDAMHPKLGAGAIGGGLTNEVTRLVISANVTITGTERTSTGAISGTVRQMRVGQQDQTPGDDNFPWGIVQQTHGLVNLEMAADPTRGDLLLSNDKTDSAGGMWEVGGTASLLVPTDAHIGAKTGVRSPGAVFRVRGSDVGSVSVGDRFQVLSRTAAWDVSEVDLGGGFRHKLNRGKAVVEFVLDADGVTPITILDNLDLGSNATVTTPMLGTQNAIMPAFLRVKLSQPTNKGLGTYNPSDPGAGDVIVLVESDRITSQITSVPAGAEELLEGRFFEPDHTNDAGTSPHRALLDGFRINSDYAGAVYSWQVNYFEDSGGSQIGTVTPAVILSGLQITGTPGDLNDDNTLDEMDRTALMNAIANPPVTPYDLINSPQHLFDLNADDFINQLDLDTFNTYFLPPAMIDGDFNGDGKVDAADYVYLRKTGAPPADFATWRTNFGSMSGGAASAGVGAVPEPGALGLTLVAMLAAAIARRTR